MAEFKVKAILCTNCGTPLQYDIMQMSNREEIKCLNQICPKCKKCGIKFYKEMDKRSE